MLALDISRLLASLGEPFSQKQKLPSLTNIVLCRPSLRRGPNNELILSARQLEIKTQPLKFLGEVQKVFPGLFNRRDFRLGCFQIVMDGS